MALLPPIMHLTARAMLYPTYGIYTVTLSVEDTNGCQYTVTHPVEVMPHPTAFFSINTPNCLGDITQFTDLSTNPPGQGYLKQWIWNFGDGSPKDTIDFPDSPNVTHQYATQGNYNVTLTVINSKGCSADYQLVVSVTNRPIAAFTSWSSCEDKVATFVDNSDENLGGQITSWNWNFGEPTSGTQNFQHARKPGAYLFHTGEFCCNADCHQPERLQRHHTKYHNRQIQTPFQFLQQPGLSEQRNAVFSRQHGYQIPEPPPFTSGILAMEQLRSAATFYTPT